MALRLYGSWISTFARKVALGLELKGLQYEHIDGLTRDFRPELRRLNPRMEVPVLVDDDVTVVNSSDILQYLELRYAELPLYPAALPERVTARALERLADQRFDALVVDCSFWHWAERDDEPPSGLREAGQRDLEMVLNCLEAALVSRPKPWPFGAPGVVECAWFANLLAARPLGFTIDAAQLPCVDHWLRAMRAHPIFANDAKRTAAFLKAQHHTSHERRKLFWSGDRIEWLLARGFHSWLAGEIAAGRAVFPE